MIDGCGDDEAAAEGAHLGLWAYDFLKAKKDPLKKLSLKPLNETTTNEWQCGEKKAKGQNFARTLMETPANHLTPKIFAKVMYLFSIIAKYIFFQNCIFLYFFRK